MKPLLLFTFVFFGVMTYLSFKRWVMVFSDEDQHNQHGAVYFMLWLLANLVFAVMSLISIVTFLFSF